MFLVCEHVKQPCCEKHNSAGKWILHSVFNWGSLEYYDGSVGTEHGVYRDKDLFNTVSNATLELRSIYKVWMQQFSKYS